MGNVFEKYGSQIEAALKKRGDFVYRVSPEQKAVWKEKTMPVYQDWIKEVKAKGMDGEAILKKVQELAEEAKKSPNKPAPWWGESWQK